MDEHSQKDDFVHETGATETFSDSSRRNVYYRQRRREAEAAEPPLAEPNS